MLTYIIRRILLMVPTILGIMLISFLVVQFAPGGPVERVIAQLTGNDVSATQRVSGGGADAVQTGAAEAANSSYRGAQGLDPSSSRASKSSSASTSRRTSASC
jgi:microcin C transport system permease protein